MKAVLGDPYGRVPQEFVAPWGPVPADYIYFGACAPDSLCQVRKQIEEPWIVLMNVTGTMVPEKAIQLAERLRDIVASDLVNDIQVLTRVGVE